MGRAERVTLAITGNLVGLTRIVILLVAVVISLASMSNDIEDGWRLDSSIDPPRVELSGADNYLGHFTVVRRNAPLHDVEARIDLAVTYTGSANSGCLVVSVIPDVAPSTINFASMTEFGSIFPDSPPEVLAVRGSDLDATCADECIDSFAVFVDRSSTQGTVTVDWMVVGAMSAYEGDEPNDVHFELRLD